MRLLKRVLLTAVGAGACAAAARADVEPAGGWPRKVPAPVVVPPNCPPGQIAPLPVMPGQPVPAQPGQAMPPATPPGTPPGTPPTAPPNLTPPATPDAAAAPRVQGASDLLAQGPGLGTDAGGSALPNVNGDLIGGGGIAGPLPVVVTPNGQIVGPLLRVILPNGQRAVIGGPNQPPTDELLRNRGIITVAPPGSRVVALFPPNGAVFDPSLADRVSRLPQVVRGPFKVGENESPQPRTRFLFSYYYYDQVFKNVGGPDVPRVEVHQEVFGYEQAFLNNMASVGIRLPYNQIASNGFYNNTSLGDITLTSKVVLLQDRCTGSLLSGGLLLTPPTGSRPFNSTITGADIGGTLIQPYLGYIFRRDKFYFQGFSSLVIPTDSRDVTLLTNGGQFGYVAYQNRTTFVTSVVPTAEIHVNTPLDNRGARRDPVGFVDQVTVLGGTQFLIRERSGLGVSVGAPVTGPRPFSIQGTVQLNFWF